MKLIASLAIATFAISAFAADFSGKWSGKLSAPKGATMSVPMGGGNMTTDLELKKNGTYEMKSMGRTMKGTWKMVKGELVLMRDGAPKDSKGMKLVPSKDGKKLTMTVRVGVRPSGSTVPPGGSGKQAEVPKETSPMLIEFTRAKA